MNVNFNAVFTGHHRHMVCENIIRIWRCLPVLRNFKKLFKSAKVFNISVWNGSGFFCCFQFMDTRYDCNSIKRIFKKEHIYIHEIIQKCNFAVAYFWKFGSVRDRIQQHLNKYLLFTENLLRFQDKRLYLWKLYIMFILVALLMISCINVGICRYIKRTYRSYYL